MADSEVTLGELDRRMTAGFAAINQRLDGLAYVPREVYVAEMNALADKVKVLEDRDRFRGRVLISAFLSAFLFPLAMAATVALVVTR